MHDGSILEKNRDGFDFISMFYPLYKRDAIRVVEDKYSIGDYQKYINQMGIEKAEIIMPNLNVLKECPSLKYLRIISDSENFDFSPLYDRREIKSLSCLDLYGREAKYLSEIDYSKVSGLVSLEVDVNKKALNYNKIPTLKSLSAGGFKGKNRDLTDLFCSKELDTLRLIQCGIYSLDGIDISQKMQCL